jgi:hypothetical protein
MNAVIPPVDRLDPRLDSIRHPVYVGLSVHAAARIGFAAHGRQIVMSSAVRAAVIESLADGVSLRSLGAWRFRACPSRSSSSKWTPLTCPPTSRLLDRPPSPRSGLGRRATDATSVALRFIDRACRQALGLGRNGGSICCS